MRRRSVSRGREKRHRPSHDQSNDGDRDDDFDHQHRVRSSSNENPKQQQVPKHRQEPEGIPKKRNQAPKNRGRRKRKQQQMMSRDKNNEQTNNKTILEWDTPFGYVPLSEEESMVQFMFERNGKHERGMLKVKPPFLVDKYKTAIHRHAPSMNLPQALSLRRHHIKLFNQFKNMTQLGLGKIADINKSARMFECAVENFLKKSSIAFLTEKEQQKEAKKEKKPLKATPDFLLPSPILLRKTRRKVAKKAYSNKKTLEERKIHWIEAKMYYGASSIPHGSKGAVGCVLATAQKYVDNFGEGAILFMMGCGEKLAAEMNNIGVSVLDCSGNTVSLEQVHRHQRTWCANEKGEILP